MIDFFDKYLMATVLSLEEILKRFKLIHGEKYDYSNFKKYSDMHMKIEVICKNHGPFLITASEHIHKKRGCHKCLKRIAHNKLSLNEVLIRFQEVHLNIYDYSTITEYIDEKSKLPIICKKHGLFHKSYGHHYGRKQGCPICVHEKRGKAQLKSKDQFIKTAISFHGDKYNYEKVIYIGAHKKIEIICKKHGEFFQTPRNHISGNDCPKCSVPFQISKIATKWLDEIGIECREFYISEANCRVDGFDEKTKTVYQFYGDYWHGNPEKYSPEDINSHNKKKFGELYQKTYSQETILKSLGYNIVSIWEKDYIKSRNDS